MTTILEVIIRKIEYPADLLLVPYIEKREDLVTWTTHEYLYLFIPIENLLLLLHATSSGLLNRDQSQYNLRVGFMMSY